MASSLRSRVNTARIISTWWPLAASWLLMGVEMPALSAIVARLPLPEINLAAYGGIVFPIALIIESPIIMLLAASTALSKDWDSYIKLRRFMNVTSGLLTGLHALIAFTPLYDLVVRVLIGAPEAIIEPGRVGLQIMLPWTWSIAYRRFHQGVLIRFGQSKMVSKGTLVRLSADLLVLFAGYFTHRIPGIVVGTMAVAAGVISEAVYVGIVVQPIVHGPLKQSPRVAIPVKLRSFLSFYAPLVLTSLLSLIAQPIGSAALSRMPLALESLAVWPVLSGLLFMFRSFGIAYNEVVVALLDEQGSSKALQQFANRLGIATSLVFLILAATNLSKVWFEEVSALTPALADLARLGLWWGGLQPLLITLQSWYQGLILFGRRTQGITEAVVLYLVVIAAILFAGTWLKLWPGVSVGVAAMTISMLIQTGWLWLRSRPVLAQVTARDSEQKNEADELGKN